MCQARTCGRVWATGTTPGGSKQWKSDVYVKTVIARSLWASFKGELSATHSDKTTAGASAPLEHQS